MTTHVIGAGLSGLACAVRLARAGRRIAVYEAAGHAGGRCRSFFDESLGCLIDNGSHLLLGANAATRLYLADIGAAGSLSELAPAAFPFRDLATGERWCVRPNAGPLPLWPWLKQRRVPRSRPGDYLAALRLARATADQTVRDCVGEGSPLYERFWQPLVRAALNTDADEASAALTWAVVRKTFLRGESACRPLHFGKGLSPTLIDPAIATLGGYDVELRYRARLRGLEIAGRRVTGLFFPEGVLRLAPGDAVVLAVPADACADLFPGIAPPDEFRAIVNAHFRVGEDVRLPWNMPFLGLVGSESQWIFMRDGILSVTISAADRHADKPAWQLANLIWGEVARALDRNTGRVPPWRIIKEKRATIAQTPAQIRRRPPTATRLENLFLAGDWTATGLPATIEGSIHSGFLAARSVLARDRGGE